ncbi:MAG: hypothetical protein SFW62_05955 [Alphaproteobacteria bacterium]|nr:hypothetical protein [Alphaproteobacteria bacterium]
MKRVLVLAKSFPHASHNYINNDVEYLASRAEILVLSLNQPRSPFYSTVPFDYFDNRKQLMEQARVFKPDIVLGWMLPNHAFARHVAENLGVPFILKLHTSDYNAPKRGWSSLARRLHTNCMSEEKLSKAYRATHRSIAKTANSKYLQGVFCLPGFREVFAPFFPEKKLFNMQPRFFYDKFHDEGPNGDRILIVGSLLQGRSTRFAFGDVIAGAGCPVDWYPVSTPGYMWTSVPNRPPNLHLQRYVPPDAMPPIYKRYKAMLLAGTGKFSRGLSLSVLEGQAAGVQTIAPSLRPDFDDFITKGGGYLFNDISEIPDLLKKIPDPAHRAMGFRNARDYDMQGAGDEFALAGLSL